MLRLVNGTISVHEFSDKSAFLKLNLSFGFFSVALLRTIKSNLNRSIKTDPHLINFAIRNICQETLDQDPLLKGYIFNDSDEDIVLLLMGDDVQSSPVELLLKKIVQNCDEFLQQEVFISLGAFVDSYLLKSKTMEEIAASIIEVMEGIFR